MRKQLLSAAKRLRDDGVLPANVQQPEIGRVRMGAFLLEQNADWKQDTTAARNPDSGNQVAHDMPLIVE